jgi:hypothetical protein
MTTVVPFLPSNLYQPKFLVELDSQDYEIRITWNISAQRYYINVYGLDGTWIITVPLLATPPARRIASAAYDSFRKVVTMKMVDPTLWPIPLSPAGLNTPPGMMVDYTMHDFTPDTYNGKFRCMKIDGVSFSFSMDTDPGPIVILGSVSRMINMVAGVFDISTLVYRNGMFEVNP